MLQKIPNRYRPTQERATCLALARAHAPGTIHIDNARRARYVRWRDGTTSPGHVVRWLIDAGMLVARPDGVWPAP